MMMPKPAVLFDQEAIARRVQELAADIARTFDGKEICVVGRMRSCLVFMADLIRKIPLDTTCHFMKTSSLRDPGSGGAARPSPDTSRWWGRKQSIRREAHRAERSPPYARDLGLGGA